MVHAALGMFSAEVSHLESGFVGDDIMALCGVRCLMLLLFAPSFAQVGSFEVPFHPSLPEVTSRLARAVSGIGMVSCDSQW